MEHTEELGLDRIKETMPLKKFETMTKYLHFNDNDKHLPRDHPNRDRLHKIRPIYDELNKKFSKVPFERHLSIDEQICSTKYRMRGMCPHCDVGLCRIAKRDDKATCFDKDWK
ncbi:piggyBac transposable element-derived protein 2 [Trichonephila clavipes]|nr:piggyBac transposable element-derived protein 2 [Trichonephila clavipes]